MRSVDILILFFNLFVPLCTLRMGGYDNNNDDYNEEMEGMGGAGEH